MPLDEHQLWQLLHALDDPDHLEFPAGYNNRRTRERFEQLAQRLDTDFACRCQVDRDVQDASLHGRIAIPAAATAAGRPLVVLISNFSELAVLAIDNPGVWTQAENRPAPAPRRRPPRTCRAGRPRFTLIPEEPLWQDYDGACHPAISHAPATWWIRYFDYF